MIENRDMIADLGQLSALAYGQVQVGEVYANQSTLEDMVYTLRHAYIVRETIDNLSSLNAILFESLDDMNGLPTGNFYLVFRGTQEVFDVADDFGIFLTNHSLQVHQGKAYVEALLDSNDWNLSKENLTLAGHSLGGIITQAIGSSLQISGYSYNPFGADNLVNIPTTPGIPLPIYQIWEQLADALGYNQIDVQWAINNLLTISFQDSGAINGDILSNAITNITSMLSGNSHLGRVLPIFGENAGPFEGHKMGILNSALLNYQGILEKFNPSVTMADLTKAYLLSGSDGYNAVNQIFLELDIQNQQDGSLSLDALGSINQQGEFDLSIHRDIAGIAAVDNDLGFAWRYSLQKLIPFAVSGPENLYSNVNVNVDLSLDNLSKSYLYDRALLLEAIVQWKFSESEYPAKINGLKYYIEDSGFEDGLYIGGSTSGQGGTNPVNRNDITNIIFGDDANNSDLEGANYDDRIYGLSGNDTLTGKKGNDRLSGGLGNDSYVFSTGDGFDRITDSEHQLGDTITVDGYLISSYEFKQIEKEENSQVKTYLAENSNSSAPSIVAYYNGTSLYIRVEGGSAYGGNSILIENFSDGYFGIELKENDVSLPEIMPPPTDFAHEIFGDLAPLDDNPSEADVDIPKDELGNIIVGEEVEDREDELFGSDENDFISSGALDDRVKAKEGDDVIEGGSGNDILDGGAGNDFVYAVTQTDAFGDPFGDPQDRNWLSGGVGDDVLVGAVGSDYLAGGSDSDIIFASGGNDYIAADFNLVAADTSWSVIEEDNVYTTYGAIESASGEDGDDYIDAGSGNDVVFSGGGDDEVYGREGDDKIWGEIGIDTISGGDGNDLIVGGSGDPEILEDDTDFLFGGFGDDVIYGSAGADYIEGGDGNDNIIGDNEEEKLPGAYHGGDLISGGLGNDEILGSGGSDEIFGDAGNDFILGDSDDLDGNFHGEDFIDGGDGDDDIIGQGASDILQGGDGNDDIFGDSTSLGAEYHGDDILSGGEGIDYLQGGGGNDLIFGDEGNDVIQGDGLADNDVMTSGDDELHGGDGDDQIEGMGGRDYITGGKGADQIHGDAVFIDGAQHGSDTIYGDSGNDIIEGGGSGDSIFGGDGNDVIIGDSDQLESAYHGDDELYGDAGDDGILGGDGDDILIGGTGNDYLDGGEGLDTYVFNTGDGADYIADISEIRLIINANITSLQQTEETSTIFYGASDSITFSNESFAQVSQALLGSYEVNLFDFRDRSTGIVVGTLGDDHVDISTDESVRLLGNFGVGQDSIGVLSGAGSSSVDETDVYVSSATPLIFFMRDVPENGVPSALIDWEAVEEQASTSSGHSLSNITLIIDDSTKTFEELTQDQYLIGTGNDDYLYGNLGNDNFLGGLGNDYLAGGEGNDTYVYYQGDGTDTIEDQYGLNEVILKRVSTDSDIEFSSDQLDLLVNIGGEESVRLKNFVYSFVGLSAPGAGYAITNEVTGTYFDLQSVFDQVYGEYIFGTTGTDVLNGTNDDDTIYTFGGNDVIRPGQGDDVIVAGYQYFDVYDYNFTIEIGRGDGFNTLVGSSNTHSPNLTINFSDADITIDDIEIKYIYSPLPGEDYKLSLTLDDGTELLLDAGYEYYTGISMNLQFADGSLWTMTPGGWGENSVLEHQYGGSSEQNTDSRIVQQVASSSDDFVSMWSELPYYINLNDGDDFLFDENGWNSFVEGGAGDDVIFSRSGNDYLYGDEGNDVLQGGQGSDVLSGGLGDDYLQGSSYNGVTAHFSQTVKDYLSQTFWYEYGYGSNDTDVYEFTMGDGIDTINAVHDSSSSEQVLRLLSDFSISNTLFFRSGDDLVLRFIGSESDSIRVVDHFSAPFDDQGITVSTSLSSIEYTGGTTLSNTNFLEHITSDSVVAVSDIIAGDSEASTSIDISVLLENDIVRDFGTATFVDVFNPIGGTVDWDSQSGLITFSPEESDSSILSFSYTISYEGQISTGFVRVSATNEAWTIDGSVLSDVISGTPGADTIVPYEGDDTINADAGDDTIFVFGLNQGFDTIRGGDGFDSVLGGSGDDVIGLDRIWRSDSIELIDGGSGFNIILANNDDSSLKFTDTQLLNIDLIDAQGGDDTIDGSLGNDTIKGGSGNDQIDGSYGDDTFIYEGLDSGFDVLEGGDGFDRILGSIDDDIIGVERFWRSDSIENIDGGSGFNIILANDDDSSLKFTDTELLNIDLIDGQGGDDTIDGSAGDDTIKGGSGNDVIDGDAGDDTFIFEGVDSGYDEIQGGEGFDTMLGSSGDDIFGLEWFWRSDSIERIDGGAGYNVILGSDDDRSLKFTDTELLNIDLIDGQGGDDTIDGSAGDDVIKGGAGNDSLDGGSGDDTFVYEGVNSGFDIVEGGSGFDSIIGSDTDDEIGFERFWRSDSIEVIDGGQGYNVITGNSTNSSMKFSNTELVNIDLIDGQEGDDNIVGSVGDNTIRGGVGDDTLEGGGGNDTFIFLRGDGDDEVNFIETDLVGDLIRFDDVASENLWFERNGDKLIISSLGSTDRVTLDNWFSSTINTHSIQSSDGSIGYDSVENLLDVMALYDMPAAADVVMTESTLEEVANEISSAWLL